MLVWSMGFVRAEIGEVITIARGDVAVCRGRA